MITVIYPLISLMFSVLFVVIMKFSDDCWDMKRDIAVLKTTLNKTRNDIDRLKNEMRKVKKNENL